MANGLGDDFADGLTNVVGGALAVHAEAASALVVADVDAAHAWALAVTFIAFIDIALCMLSDEAGNPLSIPTFALDRSFTNMQFPASRCAPCHRRPDAVRCQHAKQCNEGST